MKTCSSGRIRVLVVEDSLVARDLLVYLFNREASLEVVGTARDGQEAIELTRRLRPDVVTMDIHMPRVDGLEATRIIMETVPVPIVVVSASVIGKDVADSFRILEAGALAIVSKPDSMSGELVDKLVETVRLMAEVKVVKRWPRQAGAQSLRVGTVVRPVQPVRLVAMGASTGGPQVLKTILSGLDARFPVPVAIIQHISPGFTEGFVHWLEQSSGFPVGLAREGEYLCAGRAYVAPDGVHLLVATDGRGMCRADLSCAPAENGHRPSVSPLFRSVAEHLGGGAVGVLLTGMGRDGAAELKRMRERGAVTIAQSRESSVVPGMPGEAIDLGAATHVLPPEQIAGTLRQAVGEGGRA
ncbi:MAG: chemotaxis-specific protein-glutamate methyltransferase CheB [Zoogloea sp.]|nr:chemotaxis-specific protein-glutamate methyltransferase CheB [Zoogloea sp.]